LTTQASYRTVPLAQVVIDALAAYLKEWLLPTRPD
jgi:hypothetical protein